MKVTKMLSCSVASDNITTLFKFPYILRGDCYLSYLQRFSYDTLKIDRSFVSTMSDKVDSSAIVEAIINLGATLGMTVIAEGVETDDQVRRLRAMNCPEAQGYLFSHPLHHDAVNDFLRADNHSILQRIAH